MGKVKVQKNKQPENAKPNKQQEAKTKQPNKQLAGGVQKKNKKQNGNAGANLKKSVENIKAVEIKRNEKPNKKAAVVAQVQNITSNKNKNKKKAAKVVEKVVAESEEEEEEDSDAENSEVESDFEAEPANPKQIVSLYVGNLPLKVPKVKINELFSQYGKVLSVRIRDSANKKTNQKADHCIGFVDYGSVEEATAGLALNGHKVKGQVITVEFDEKKVKNVLKQAANDADQPKTPRVSVFVGNLPINTKRNKLMKLFSKFGTILGIRFRKNDGARFFKAQSKITSSSVIAFIDFGTFEEASASLVLNGEKVKDNIIRVDIQAHVKQDEAFDSKRTVFVGNLSYGTTDDILNNTFGCCGEIEYVRTIQCPKGCNGTAYVCFTDPSSVSMALELNKTLVDKREIRVLRYSARKTNNNAANAKKRMGHKQKQAGGAANQHKKAGFAGAGNKKNDFSGKKVSNNEKKKLKKKSKGLKGPKLLAKKISPREKVTAEA